MKKENYIPFSKEILLEKQLEQSYTNETDATNFKRLFHILEHYFHYEGFGLNQQLKLGLPSDTGRNRPKTNDLFRKIIIRTLPQDPPWEGAPRSKRTAGIWWWSVSF